MSAIFPVSIEAQVDDLIEEAFGETFPRDEAILGERDEDIVASDRLELLRNPRNVVSVLTDDNDGILGFSLAVPIGDFDPTRSSESQETAYVYWTAIQRGLRGQRLVGNLQGNLHRDLIGRGFTKFEEDVMIENGYAANVITAYAGAISLIEPHCRWPKVGYQARIAVDLTDESKLP